MSIIYLDQWVYVRLLRSHKRLSPEYEKYSTICQGIIDSSEKGVNVFPFSVAHLVETSRRAKQSSKKDLFKFIFDLSKFHTIRPWDQVINLEIRNAILKSLNCEPIDFSDYVFGNELAHCFGCKTEIAFKTSDNRIEIPDEIMDELYSSLKNPELLADALCKADMKEHIRQGIQRDIDLAAKLEELRVIEYSHPDKKMRHKISTARFLMTIIGESFVKEVFNFKVLDFEQYCKFIFSSEESADAFLKSIPTAYVFHVLNDARNQNLSRAVEPNDIWDICILAVAVPYCDVVVTEREWSNILNQNKIGELYNTKIIHNIEDLSAYI